MAKRIAGSKAEVLRQKVEGGRTGVDLTKCGWLDKTLVKELKAAMRVRAKVKKAEGELKKQKDDANEIIKSMMGALEISTAYINNVGTVATYNSTRTSLQRDQLMEAFLTHGVPAEVIQRCMEIATKTVATSGVRFTK